MFMKQALDESQQSTMTKFTTLSAIPGFSSFSSITESLKSLGLKLDVLEVTDNVLLPEEYGAEHVIAPEVTPVDLENPTKRLQELLYGVQLIMRSGKAGYYFIVASKIS